MAIQAWVDTTILVSALLIAMSVHECGHWAMAQYFGIPVVNVEFGRGTGPAWVWRRSPEGKPIGRSGILVGGQGAVAGVAIGATAGIDAAMAAIDGAVAAQAARSWSIALRRQSDSKAVVIVSHLTEDRGSALLNDLARTIRGL